MENTNNLSSWVEDYTADLIAWAQSKVSDPEIAKDLVQDTYLAAAEKIQLFKGDSSPKTWLIAILNNKVVDHYRKQVKQPLNVKDDILSNFFSNDGSWKKEKMPDSWQDDEHLLDNPDFLNVLKKCLSLLPEKWNICVKYKYLLNKKGEDICQELDITATNFWQIIHRAKLQLRGCVEDNWFKNN